MVQNLTENKVFPLIHPWKLLEKINDYSFEPYISIPLNKSLLFMYIVVFVAISVIMIK